MLEASYPYYVANQPRTPNQDLEVTEKFTGLVATRVALADEAAIDEAIGSAVSVAPTLARMPSYQRQAVLEHCVRRFQERFEELAVTLCIEAGKPIKDSRGEVSRLIDTFKIATEESVRRGGEVMKLDRTPRTEGYTGMWKLSLIHI